MKSPKDLAQSLFRGADVYATKVSTYRRLAGGILNLPVDELGLTLKEQETLAKARALLGEIAATYDKAAKLKKHAEAARAQRQKDVRAAMKDTFDAVVTVADKVAVIAVIRRHSCESGGVGYDAKDVWSAQYFLTEFFRQCLDDISWPETKGLTPAAEAALLWEKFQARRAELQDRHATLIVRLERYLAAAAKPAEAVK